MKLLNKLQISRGAIFQIGGGLGLLTIAVMILSSKANDMTQYGSHHLEGPITDGADRGRLE